MYELRYEHLPKYEAEFSGRIEIAGGDTDSFFLACYNMDVYEQLLPAMKRDGLLDSSNYPSDHPLFSINCKAKLGCIKDEAAGQRFKEWIMLRPKCYSMKKVSNKDIKRAKGVRRAVVSKVIKHKDYKRAYKQQVKLIHEQMRIASKLHKISTLTYNKISLNFSKINVLG